MKLSYDPGFAPPAPVVPVIVRAPRGIDGAALSGKLDTGADLCAIPEQLVVELALPAVRILRVAGFAGVVQEARVYRVDVEIDGTRFAAVEAVTTRRPYAIIGRPVLAAYVLRLDGPRRQLELKRPRIRGGRR